MGEVTFLSLGSNMGDREAYLRRALTQIEKRCGRLIRVSEIYDTPPWGFEAEQNFLNICASVQTALSPELLMDELLKIEQLLGRARTNSEGYTSRPIDIDILTIGKRVLKSSKLEIPHPRMEMRKFVLLPLLEIAPDFKHPKSAKTIQQIITECNDGTVVKLYESK